MGTVLSFSPRERRPIYTTHHHGSGTISTSNSNSDFQLNNYAYEQMNNAKNRENSKPMQYLTVPNQFQIPNGSNPLFGSSNSNIMNNNLTASNGSIDERQADNARILSEKNAIEKNLKKHSLFINALSWKRLSSSHGKKKVESNNVKNKSGGITTSSFRPPGLTDTVHPMVVVNDKPKYQKQHIQLVSNKKNAHANNQQPIQQPLQNQTIFYTSGDPKNVLSLDLERAANNANNLHHHHNVDKVTTKSSIPVRPIQLTQQSSKVDHQQPAPRKTIIQVSLSLN
ncbi:CLUMA_CG017439, isoform A [Clunio marinus]|uniref:CLUMA_CG017439, isoform A n=1 Tax=Clunio marinus TaxID=568069 RepID=A0A1J1IXB4_9DIPT|nr:CLUMA_CG017439, isoform A [Clunio marinus]